ncbi:MAG: C1 family peptidase [Planctomycetota bacterium]|jgi:C1A family cysteine protease
MKGYRRVGSIVIVGIISCLLFVSLSFADSNELAEIRAAIKAKGANWTAGESWVTRLSPEERRKLLGEMTMESGSQESSDPPPTDGYPTAIDWRNVGGYNWITPIRDQASCGSCVAFGSCATVESLARIEQGQPTLDIDLSEMHLFNCGGGSCSSGWYNSSACAYLKNNGAPDEACWPYVPVNQSCSNTCPDWQSRATKITNYARISGIESHKTYVAIAPILVAYEVYSDFYSYSGGIYERTPGSTYEGGHAVSIVGYDTTTGPVPVDYWIVKNSWGASWGESGYFRIKMGECNIEHRSSYWMSGAILPLPSEEPIPDIKANGSDDLIVVVFPGENTDVTISLDPGEKAGELADWWGVVIAPFGILPLFNFQGPMFNLPETSLIDIPLPPGWYTFIFNLDDTPDATFNLMWYDYVTVWQL